jgi:DNA-binding transcriptional LysR family regulator
MAELPNLEWLDAFVAFSERLNLTQTAKALHLSQPALHLQLAKLSEQLGVTLYRRQGRSLVLTDAGRRVSAFGRDLRSRAQGFVDELRTGENQQPIVLCAGEGAYLYLLGTGIQAFSREGTRHLQLMTRDAAGTVEAVASNEAQVGVAALAVPPARLNGGRLTEVGQVLVLPPTHDLARQRRVRLSDLSGQRLIVPPSGRPHRMLIDQALQERSVSWEVAVEATGWELMLRFVQLGLGLSIVNACCRIPEDLIALPLPELPPVRYHLLWKGDAEPGLRKLLYQHRDAWRR